jgi:putative FmdB family regulatory protein
MPVYKYLCEECGGITKISRRMTEQKTPDKCIQCGSRKLSRVYSPVGISVKGASSTEISTCCGKDSPCSAPPCSDGGVCQKY